MSYYFSLGKNCEQQCECYNNAKCDHITGECECADGFFGPKCFDNCPSHTYGFNCTEECKCTFVYQMKNNYQMHDDIFIKQNFVDFLANEQVKMVQNVIQLMEVAHAQKVGKVKRVMNAFVQIICTVKHVKIDANVKQITRKAAIHIRANVIVLPVGVVRPAVDHVHF